MGHLADIAGVVFWLAAVPYLLSALSSAASLLLRMLHTTQVVRVMAGRLGLFALLFGVVNTGVLVQFLRSRFLAGGRSVNPGSSVAENLSWEGAVLVTAGTAVAVLALLAAAAALSATRRIGDCR